MAKINYKPANLRGLGSDHQIKPGLNTVPDEIWKRWKDHPEIKSLIDSGDVQVLAETDKPKGKPGPKPKDEQPPEGDKGETEPNEAEKLKAEMQAAIAKAEAAAKAAK